MIMDRKANRKDSEQATGANLAITGLGIAKEILRGARATILGERADTTTERERAAATISRAREALLIRGEKAKV
jgi:hypothetical protein